MKANRAIRNDRAEVGVGTLIVFIAMVLVAAVAAAVLINTTGTLQQRAQATGKEATQEVSSNLKGVNVFGVDTSGEIDELRLNVQLSAGALPMDLEQLIIRYSDGVNTFNYAWNQAYDSAVGDPAVNVCDVTLPAQQVDPGTADASADPDLLEERFVAHWLRPTPTAANDLGCSGTSVMEAGDLVELRFALTTANALAVRSDAFISLIPESGNAATADFRTPASYSGDTYITLR